MMSGAGDARPVVRGDRGDEGMGPGADVAPVTIRDSIRKIPVKTLEKNRCEKRERTEGVEMR